MRGVSVPVNLQADRALEKFVRRLTKKVSVQAIYLAGSFARGEGTDASDLDLIVVSDELRRASQEERYGMVYGLLDYHDADIFVLSAEEMKMKMKEPAFRYLARAMRKLA